MEYFKKKRGSAKKDANRILGNGLDMVRKFGSSFILNERGASGNSSMPALAATTGEGSRVSGGKVP